MAKIKVTLDEGAAMPQNAHASDVGYDVKALYVTIESHMSDRDGSKRPFCIVCDTGVHVEPEEGYYVELVPNSRFGKTNYIYGNSVGIIDPDYRGSIKVVFNVIGPEEKDSYRIPSPGDVVGQLIVRKREDAEFIQVDELTPTARGEGGFGSTDVGRIMERILAARSRI